MTIAEAREIFSDDLPIRTPRKSRMTRREFLDWCKANEDIKAEWVDGEVIVMAPANFHHIDLNWWLMTLLRHYCEARDIGVTAFDMFVDLHPGRKQLRIPDVFFVSKARAAIVEENRINGAPDLAMEIVSPDSGSRDWRQKYDAYRIAGVREYWVVDPMSEVVEAYALSRGEFAPIAPKNGKIASKVVAGWYLKPAWLWKKPRMKVLDALAELNRKR